MITLGIETATTTVSVALGGDDGLLGTVEINHGRRHAEVLTPAIQFLCHQAQVAIGNIGAIGVDVGPGLFTGMRVGIATAKTMAQALRIPVVGVSSLEVLASPLRTDERVIVSVVDARKGEVFSAFFRFGQQLTDPRVGTIDDLNADIAARGQEVLAVGDGAWRYREQFDAGVEVAELVHPSAVSVVRLARPLALHAEADGLALEVHPLYLRAPDAEINWKSR